MSSDGSSIFTEDMPAPSFVPAAVDKRDAGADEPRVDGATIVYRLYDVGYAIQLDRAAQLLAGSTPARARPVRGEGQALQIANPPLTAALGVEALAVDGVTYPAEISVRLFDFGVCSFRVHVAAPSGMPWGTFSRFGSCIDAEIDLTPVFTRHVQALTARIAMAVERPQLSAVTEDFVVFRLTRLADAAGRALPTTVLREEDIVTLLFAERRPLSASARRELLPERYRFSYYDDDMAILTWDNALVLEPVPQDADIQYILEFANAQLLEFRVYDALLDAELPTMYERIATARASRLPLFGRGLRRILATLHTRVADITEPVERVDNALKVTEDVYLARVYAAALELFREQAWRRGIERKLDIMRETYEMLNAEAQAGRSELLEVAIIILIVAELVLALLGQR